MTMEAVSLDNLAIVAAVAFGAPLLLGLAPGLRIPSVLLEILAGVVLGPSVLNWVQADTAVDVLALIGVGFLLLLAGLEIDFEQLRGRLLSVALIGFAVSFMLALGVSYGLSAGGVVSSPFLIAVMLSATSLAVVLPLLKDSGLIESRFGQVVIAGASIADVATVVLLSLFFSGEATSLESRLVLFAVFGLLCVIVAALIAAGGHLSRLSGVLVQLQDTTAQIRVRGTFLLLLVFSIVAQRFGLEAILGTFLAGVILKLADRDGMMTHSHFHAKLEEAGFGFFIPVFFVASGIRFDAQALFADGSTLAKVPIFLIALYVIRGLPALLYRPLIGNQLTIAAGVLQATTLSFVLIASQIGEQLGMITTATAAALTAAALLSVLINPVVALTLIRTPTKSATSPPTGEAKVPQGLRFNGGSECVGVRRPSRSGMPPSFARMSQALRSRRSSTSPGSPLATSDRSAPSATRSSRIRARGSTSVFSIRSAITSTSTDARVVRITVTDEGSRRLACAIRSLADERAELRRALLEATRRHPARAGWLHRLRSRNPASTTCGKVGNTPPSASARSVVRSRSRRQAVH